MLHCFPSRKQHRGTVKLQFDFMLLQQLKHFLLSQVGTLNIFSKKNTQLYTLHWENKRCVRHSPFYEISCIISPNCLFRLWYLSRICITVLKIYLNPYYIKASLHLSRQKWSFPSFENQQHFIHARLTPFMPSIMSICVDRLTFPNTLPTVLIQYLLNKNI